MYLHQHSLPWLLEFSLCRLKTVSLYHRPSQIRHLSLNKCSRVKLLGMNFEVPNLARVLNLSKTPVDDETLYVISKSCRGLLHLILQHCDDVTEKGVKHACGSKLHQTERD
ncbi:F-box/LRR protein [Trifolium pratense]|uniref:F-box/LRR protein n=1 Tax=Trifolium pratense TaxID=57577 RepID=A0A2K3MW29_TRIPR|nr:F-box/LRR protein [Trifolium pratense]